MSRISFTYVQPDGVEKKVEAEDVGSVMETALRKGVDGILGTCGGNMSCGTCHVELSAALYAELDKPDDDEEAMLGTLERRTPTSRLSCQIRVTPDLQGARFKVMGEE